MRRGLACAFSKEKRRRQSAAKTKNFSGITKRADNGDGNVHRGAVRGQDVPQVETTTTLEHRRTRRGNRNAAAGVPPRVRIPSCARSMGLGDKLSQKIARLSPRITRTKNRSAKSLESRYDLGRPSIRIYRASTNDFASRSCPRPPPRCCCGRRKHRRLSPRLFRAPWHPCGACPPRSSCPQRVAHSCLRTCLPNQSLRRACSLRRVRRSQRSLVR